MMLADNLLLISEQQYYSYPHLVLVLCIYNEFLIFFPIHIAKNQFECMQGLCVNSGTLYNSGADTVYKFKLDATEFVAGVLTFYVLGTTGNAEVTISDAVGFVNADKYTIDLAEMAHGDDGYTAVVVDLSQEPTDIGNGWSATGDSIYVKVKSMGFPLFIFSLNSSSFKTCNIPHLPDKRTKALSSKQVIRLSS